MKIDLNCDMGESFGAWQMGCDTEILPYISSINIACGFHASDPSIMHKTVKNALANGVAIGAHPGLPDLVGFGRRNMRISPQEAYDMVIYQVSALKGFIHVLGGKLHHVKPHGALYNMAAINGDLAYAIAKATQDTDKNAILYGLAGSELIKQAEKIGLKFAKEVFADRSYQNDGTLTPRTEKGALLENDEKTLFQVLSIVKDGVVRTLQGNQIKLQADTICIHGDGINALSFAKKINSLFIKTGIQISAA